MLHPSDLLLKMLRPANVLVSLMRNRPAYEKHWPGGPIKQEIGLDRTDGNPSAEELARLDRDAPLIREQFEADAAFRTAVERLATAGVTYEFGGQCDPCGSFTVLRLAARPTAFPALEALAADDAGITDPDARATAARNFHVYMLRNHHPDWQANRELYPDVGGSPYQDPGHRPGNT